MLGKRIINSNNAAAGGACTTNTNDYPTTNVAYYKMSSAADEKGTYNGTATNVNFNVQGKFGNAGEFNGSSSYISLPNLGISGNQAFSVSFWVYKDAATSGLDFVYFQGNLQNSQAIQLYFTANETFNVDYYFTAGYYTSSNIITLNKWHHIVATFSGGALQDPNNTDIYVDGSLVAKTASINGSGNANFGNTNYNIGRRTDGYYFDGTLDQVRIFSSALDATQVASLYNEVYCVPTIVPTSYFNSVLYTGNSSTQAITGVGFAPDFVWIKRRSSSEDHAIYDSIRGTNKQLSSNTTSAEATNSSPYLGLTSFDSDGFTSGNNGGTNRNPYTYVAWSWKAGGAEVQNTDGTITSQVSANVDAGFSIVSFTSNGAASPVSTGHGLSSVPELVIFKNRDDTSQWPVFHKDIGFNGRLQLEDTSSVSTFTPFFDITSTTIAVRQSSLASNGNECIAYCFHSVDGYSKIGSYTGNGSATGPTVVTGFRPAFVMIKCSSSTESGGASWLIYDNKRSTTNPLDKRLYAEGSYQEAQNSLYDLDFLSNGFQPLNGASNYGYNTSGNTYIFMAFAEEGLPYVTRNATDPFGDSSELALYKFEDNANDAEGSYNGTASNVTYASGYIDKAASFNGSSSLISLPTGVDRNNNFTLSFWVNFNTLSDYDSLITLQLNYRIYTNTTYDGRLYFYDGNTTLITSAGVVATGNWYNIVVTKSSTLVNGKGMIIYVNGVDVANNSVTANAINASSPGLNLLGAYNAASASSAFYLDGKLDQVRIFNRALDDGEVTALYNE